MRKRVDQLAASGELTSGEHAQLVAAIEARV